MISAAATTTVYKLTYKDGLKGLNERVRRGGGCNRRIGLTLRGNITLLTATLIKEGFGRGEEGKSEENTQNTHLNLFMTKFNLKSNLSFELYLFFFFVNRLSYDVLF